MYKISQKKKSLWNFFLQTHYTQWASKLKFFTLWYILEKFREELFSLYFVAADRLKNFYIDVGDGDTSQQCAFDSVSYSASETRVYQCQSVLFGRYVTIRFGPSEEQFLQLCEVQILGECELKLSPLFPLITHDIFKYLKILPWDRRW